MKHVFEALAQALAAGRGAVLCSIVESSGSTPRGPGAKMLVLDQGKTVGTVGGGAVEHAAIETALEIHHTHTAQLARFCLAPNEAADLGMICGGDVRILFQYAEPSQLPLAEAALALLDEARDAWLVTVLAEGRAESGLYDREKGLRFLKTVADLTPLLRRQPVFQDGEAALYAEPLCRRGQVYVFGGGHVSQALVPVLAHADFRVTVFEERPQFADPALFPDAAQVLLGDYWDMGKTVKLQPWDYAVVLTRGHQGDYALLEQLLRLPLAYVGCIGSRRKAAVTAQRLLEAGVPAEAVARLHSPIGLEIGAETPVEIAVSIAAQLIQCRAARQATP